MHRMFKKKLLSYGLTLIGLTGLTMGFYYNHKLNKAASTGARILSPFQDDTFGSLIGSSAEKKIRGYRIKIHGLIIVSSIITAYGVSRLLTKKDP